MAKRTGIAFEMLCELNGLPAPVPEFRFSPPRRWRFDWAWPHYMPPDNAGAWLGGVALEVEGGVFMKGGSRHTRGAGFRSDLEKYSEAAAQGWRIIRVLPEQLESTTTFDWIRRALG